ncbi:DUF4404 family protein [Facilibium subflavum]|uniref:DUF4404 family protein n=1 Tax=Facilibium subflavum TaxID=2219058 RepID=UPI000E653F71|nr:DUF4404 family protein [Facilibium subflavum]
MPKDTIADIKKLLQSTDKLSYAQTEELSALLNQLQLELEKFPPEKKQQAIDIASLTRQKIYASRAQDSQGHDLNDLEEAIVEYEATHPRLVHTIRSICNLLASIGI